MLSSVHVIELHGDLRRFVMQADANALRFVLLPAIDRKRTLKCTHLQFCEIGFY